MKYEFTGETKRFGDITLHRIRALQDFGDVKTGDPGGWLESEANLSHDGDCWVRDNAQVFDDARVYGDALVFGHARVFGNAWVYGDAWVRDNAQVFDDARVYGDALVFDDARVFGNERKRQNG
jgi:hypothetical protein